ncbi:glycosyltransferase involved in cell wall biosynthesis [Roseivirga ehrenbergii]|uniref:Glycosyltransferase WbuB n=1 Tax=Roseivirga ehrenbergii (strain DSM 102268 / JCM 13514 / KCTC 12282 / NCIMB 14502 / KMM 6017) TaxID=279360 RepID=A0A150XC43_ROSEK|nr:glycosyltransferase family 4 protein [Roseivirga ehrenbergii]KYG76244.1 glycosyltransferase WbuB [Roseivirga ehrenbergii]TCL00228.1 glycosyltransferase involved in cell wall biosynthesis [Roseivirga ehrenbergii]
MKILYLTFYFEPDLCAGSFRNTPLAYELNRKLKEGDEVHVITTMPNRYKSFKEDAQEVERIDKLFIQRIPIPDHQSGFSDQINSFKTFFFNALKLTKGNHYDLVFASSSRLFTAFLGRYLANKHKVNLYLDIRDIFTDTMNEVLESKALKALSLPVLRKIEKYTFRNANHINLVSGGFEEYFKKFKKPSYSFFTNGIDDEFLNLPESKERVRDQYIITYAGNIGEGQGLHKIIPQAAKALGDDYKFVIIGDGGAKGKLIDQIEKIGGANIELIEPVNRAALKDYYLKSDFLFLHLNDFRAFEKVLPSKIFEYGAYDKPIIAGVAGFASRFIQENLQNYILFAPGDVDSFVSSIKSFEFRNQRRSEFISTFSRKNITERMADDIISNVKKGNQ